MKNSTKMINPHGRHVAVMNARVAGLLKAGYQLAPEVPPAAPAKDAPAPAPPADDQDDELTDVQRELRDDLAKLTKVDIAAFALDTFSLELNPASLNKDEMIALTIAEMAE